MFADSHTACEQGYIVKNLRQLLAKSLIRVYSLSQNRRDFLLFTPMYQKFVFLGTGASSGIPVIGCPCATCSSLCPYNQRLRTAGFFKLGNKTILVDVGPDFRQQALKHKIFHLDGLLLTHTHFDHIAGIDELRIYNIRQKDSIPCLLSEESFEDLKIRYDYLMQPVESTKPSRAQLALHLLPDRSGEILFLQEKIKYFSYSQGAMKVTGYRIGDFSYVPDIRSYSDAIFNSLAQTRILVLGVLAARLSYSHFSLDEAISFAKKVGAEMTYLVHMNHELEHTETNAKLPANIQLAYDGLEVELGT